jgi:hypothetical protein
MNTDPKNGIAEPDDASNVFIVEHVLIRDRASGAVLLNRRGTRVVTKTISEEDRNADDCKTTG